MQKSALSLQSRRRTRPHRRNVGASWTSSPKTGGNSRPKDRLRTQPVRRASDIGWSSPPAATARSGPSSTGCANGAVARTGHHPRRHGQHFMASSAGQDFPLESGPTIVTGEVQALDCGVVNGLHFVNIFSFGIFTTTSRRTADEHESFRLGKLAYIVEASGAAPYARHSAACAHREQGSSISTHSWHSSSTAKRPAGFRLANTSSVRDGIFDCLRSKSATTRILLASPWYATSPASHPAASGCAQRRFSANPPTSTASRGARFPLDVRCLPGLLRVVCDGRR